MKNLYVVIGRFQPLHHGHISMIDEAHRLARENDGHVLVLVGSSNKKRSIDNPYSYDERCDMILKQWPTEEGTVMPLPDYDYSYKRWETLLYRTINYKLSKIQVEISDNISITFITSNKGVDGDLRKDWARDHQIISVSPVDYEFNDFPISATNIRQSLIVGDRAGVQERVSESTWGVIESNWDAVECMNADARTIRQYNRMWEDAPFTPTFHATDAVVRDPNGMMLFIERGGEMGTGQIALAGGFLEADISHEANMIKELKEETCLDLDAKGHKIVTSWFCDETKRAMRGRMTTMVFLVDVDHEFRWVDGKLYLGSDLIEPKDDASKVMLINQLDITDHYMFSDHHGLVTKVLELENAGIPYIKNF